MEPTLKPGSHVRRNLQTPIQGRSYVERKRKHIETRMRSWRTKSTLTRVELLLGRLSWGFRG